MSIIYTPIPLTDSTVSAGTNPAKTGLTPTVLAGYLISAPATTIASGNYPVITGAGGGATGASGIYVAAYDAEANGEACFEIDAGAGLTANADRFFYLICTRDSSRILAGFSSTGVVPSVAGAVGSVTGNVGGTVASVVGAVGSVTGAAGSVTAPVVLPTIPPTGYGSVPLTGGLSIVGSTASVVIVSGLPAGRSYSTQKLYHVPSGEARVIVSQTVGGGNYTFTMGVGVGELGPFSAAPTIGDTHCPVP